MRISDWSSDVCSSDLRIALTPTMGNLHRGHLRLVEAGHEQAQRVVTSVFVNPLKFGLNEDFDRYPRTLDADAAKTDEAGCDLLFALSLTEKDRKSVLLGKSVAVGVNHSGSLVR